MAYTDTQARTRTRLPDDGDHPAQRRRLRRPAVAAAILAVALVAVLAAEGLARHGSSSPHATPPVRAAGPAAAAGPHIVAGVPVGYPDTPAGAQAAAANYVVAFASAPMFVPASRHQIIAAVADPTVASALQAQYDVAFAATTSRFGLDANGQPPAGLQFVARALPVGVHTDAYAGGAARVSVWSDGLIGLAGTGSTQPVSEAWSTTVVSLRWARGDWKWVTASQTDGPTPVPGLQSPSSATAIAQATSTFAGLRYAP